MYKWSGVVLCWCCLNAWPQQCVRGAQCAATITWFLMLRAQHRIGDVEKTHQQPPVWKIGFYMGYKTMLWLWVARARARARACPGPGRHPRHCYYHLFYMSASTTQKDGIMVSRSFLWWLLDFRDGTNTRVMFRIFFYLFFYTGIDVFRGVNKQRRHVCHRTQRTFKGASFRLYLFIKVFFPLETQTYHLS